MLSAIPIAVIASIPLHLNDTSTTSVCPSQSGVALVLSNFSDTDYSSFHLALPSPEISTTIGLVQKIKSDTVTYQGKVSLQQARDIRLYVLPGSWFIITFSFSDASENKNLTVKFTVYSQDGRPGKTFNSQPVGPFTTSRSVRFSAIDSSYVEVTIVNNEGLTGYYDYTFLIEELHKFEKWTVLNSTVTSCSTNQVLPGRNIIVGMPSRDSEVAQCHPMISVSLFGKKIQTELIATVSIAVFIVCSVVTALVIIGCVWCKQYNRFAKYRQLY